jgi:hypothetical protein
LPTPESARPSGLQVFHTLDVGTLAPTFFRIVLELEIESLRKTLLATEVFSFKLSKNAPLQTSAFRSKCHVGRERCPSTYQLLFFDIVARCSLLRLGTFRYGARREVEGEGEGRGRGLCPMPDFGRILIGRALIGSCPPADLRSAGLADFDALPNRIRSRPALNQFVAVSGSGSLSKLTPVLGSMVLYPGGYGKTAH